MKKLLLLLLLIVSFGVVGCDMNEPPHEHQYVDGICSCGVSDPNYVSPHEHIYTDGVCACGELEPNRLFIEYDKEVIYTQYGKLKVTSTYQDDEIKIASRNYGIARVAKGQPNDMIIYGVCPGTATIVITNKYDEEIELTINVVTNEEYSPILGFNVSLVEEGPYYMGEVYHVEVSTNPSNYVDDEYGFIKNSLYDFDKKTMEIVFNHTGTFDFQVYSTVMNITEKYEIEIIPNPNREEYHVLYVGNSLTYVHDIPKIVKNMVESAGGYFSYIQQTVGGAYIKDHENNFYRNMDLYTFTDVILQGQSFEPIGNYSLFEEYMIKYSNRVHETDANLFVYQTWGYDVEKWTSFVDGSLETFTQKELYDGLQNAYDRVATKVNASVIRSGEAFELCLEEYDLPSLYQDMNHQSIYGAYLSACCHFAMLTQKSPIGNSYIPDGIDSDTASIIQQIADRVCFIY